MGAKTWMIVYSDANAREALAARPALDREATRALATRLFPKETLYPLEDGSLRYTCPRNHELCVGCFPGVSIVAAKEFRQDFPSKLPLRFIEAGGRGTVTLHAMHSVVDWFAFAQWKDGRIVRSLSLSPESGILEDIGTRMDFEEPFWAKEFSAFDDSDDEYPFPFHAQELAETALAELCGYHLEGPIDTSLIDANTIPLARFKRSQSFWKFWS
jgi:hypothetical protein